MSTKRDKILRIIEAIRESHPDLTVIYTQGSCYEFSNILKQIFPEAKSYRTYDNNHIVTRIDEYFYDIYGDVTNQADTHYIPVDKRFIKKEQPYWWVEQFTNKSKIKSRTHRLARTLTIRELLKVIWGKIWN